MAERGRTVIRCLATIRFPPCTLRSESCNPGDAAQGIHLGLAGTHVGVLPMGRDLAAAEDQSTQAKAINIALATSAEPSTHERRTNERSTTTTAGAAAAPNNVGPLTTEDQHGSYMATVRLIVKMTWQRELKGPSGNLQKHL